MDNTTIELHYCKKHGEWYSNNCSNCMLDTNEPQIKAQVAKEIYEALEMEWNTVKWIGKLPLMHNLKIYTLDN
jgi:hypothetical protein